MKLSIETYETAQKATDESTEKTEKDDKETLEIVWEKVSPRDAELRIQQAFEMLLGDEFNLPNNPHNLHKNTENNYTEASD